MKVLVIGGGGREHAIAWRLSQSPRVTKLFCAPGNPGTASIAANVPVAADDVEGLLAFAQKERIDFTVVGPEIPLVKGVVNLFQKNGLKIFGPTQSAARLEGSKVFMKEMLVKAGIPTAHYKAFTSAASAIAYLETAPFPLVIKADGLAAGKGVLVTGDKTEAEIFISATMEFGAFGDSGDTIIIEQFLPGEEASYIVVADGADFVPLASAQDHKRIFDGDKGPNTGGMGAYSPAPVVTKEVDEKIRRKVIAPLIKTMREEGCPFTGFLYAGIMVSNGEPYVLEFNVRLGDPEAQPLMFRYHGDLLTLLEAAVAGNVMSVTPQWKNDAAVCVVIASDGYPGDFAKGFPIEGLNADAENVVVFHAGTKLEGGKIVTAGGRVLGVTAGGSTIEEAVRRAYERAATIKFKDMFYRKDIAHRAINRK
ncbi:MAG: phosphoribosylamine--glycine ligase [Nitrospinae bacterium]|nr:phosphoribosylamine--glycine ligase [Nitrospinota bacterium]